MSEPENFLPWSMLEPLLVPGMIADDFVHVVLAKLGLPYADYTLVSVDVAGDDARTISLLELCRRGLRVVKNPNESVSRGEEIIIA